ncbi:MAG: DUF354 domain-containing protein [Oscillospiraceae bacterium]|jgi:spore coat polysaccharide biosynthesis predicted glycosyltransferase SpsG|nr:DUF354 domain-containing protein [Oscillospiraceae bacterium]
MCEDSIKIAFVIAYGNQYGLGHYVRMNTLADVFVKYNCICEFITDVNTDLGNYDIVIIDTYWVTDEFIANTNKFTVCYDDNALYCYSCDVLINANFYAEELNLRFGNKKPELLLGSKYALLRKQFQISEPISVKEKAEKIFVCFGGSDLRNFTPKIVETLKDYNLEIVLGAETQCDENIKLPFHKNPENIAEIMKKCDIAVTACGSMVYELASLGLPFIAVVQADNQQLVSEYIDKNNLGTICGDWNNFDSLQLKEEVELLIGNYERRVEEHNNLIKAVNKNGAELVAKGILEEYGKYCNSNT